VQRLCREKGEYDKSLEYFLKNLAASAELNDEQGKVNISQDTYELIKDNAYFSFEARGKIQVKGKGKVEMWFVEKVS